MEKLSSKMIEAIDALRAHGPVAHVVERFPLSTWKALVRRDLVELYMDADRTYVRNLKLTAAGVEVSDAPR